MVRVQSICALPNSLGFIAGTLVSTKTVKKKAKDLVRIQMDLFTMAHIAPVLRLVMAHALGKMETLLRENMPTTKCMVRVLFVGLQGMYTRVNLQMTGGMVRAHWCPKTAGVRAGSGIKERSLPSMKANKIYGMNAEHNTFGRCLFAHIWKTWTANFG